MTERAVVIERPGVLEVRAVEPPIADTGEVLVRVAYAGICGSDRDLLAGTRPEGFVRYPIVPGHEWSGTVESIGARVDPSLVGRPVVAEGFHPCGRCAACARGDTTLCDGPYEETGFTQPGAWADHLVVPAALVHVLPDAADLRAAAGLEPAACAAGAVLLAAPAPDDRVAVVGGGNLGLLAVQLLAAGGVRDLTVIDPDTGIEPAARRCGATSVRTSGDHETDRFDVVIEAAGAPGTAELATLLARRGGRVVLSGIPAADDHLGAAPIVTANLTILTVFGASTRAWVHAVDAFARGDLDPSILMTHEVGLDDVAEAFRLLDEHAPGLGKVLLRP